MTRALDLLLCIVSVIWVCATVCRWAGGEPASSVVWLLAICCGIAIAWRSAVAALRS